MRIIDKAAFAQRLAKSFEEKKGFPFKHGLYTKLANRYEVSKQTPNDWFNPKQGFPSYEMLARIVNDLDVSVDYLLFGLHSTDSLALPVLSPSEAVKLSEGKEVNSEQWVPAMYEVREGFALAVADDSMVSTDDSKYLAPGSLAIFDLAKKEPKSNELVFANVNGQGVFAKYINYGGQEYLSPLNRRYRDIDGPFKVLATFVYNICR